MSRTKKSPIESKAKEIKRATKRKFSAEEKNRIVKGRKTQYTFGNKPSSVTMLRTVQELNPEYHIVFCLKTNTYYKDKEILEVQLCV